MFTLIFSLLLTFGQTEDNVRTLKSESIDLYVCPDYQTDFIQIESFEAKRDRCKIIHKLLLSSQPLSFLEKGEICEKSPWDIYRIYSSAKTAMALERFLFKERAPDTESNAFGHCVLAGLLTKNLGYVAAANYLNARERGKDRNGDEDSAGSRMMDVSNNNSGIKAGLHLIESQNFSVEALARSCLDLLESRELIVRIKKFSLPVEYNAEAMKKVIQQNQ